MSGSESSKTKPVQIYKMQIPEKEPPTETAIQYYDSMIENEVYSNFMIIFGYPFVINWDTSKKGDPYIYIETGSSTILKLCKNALKERDIVYLGYFSSECNLNTVYVDGKIQSIRSIDKRRSVKINNYSPQQVKHYRIKILPRKWVFGEFVGSSARNPNVTEDNFNVQRKLYFRNNVFDKMKYVVSPCDNTDKYSIFTYDCNLVSDVSDTMSSE
jgi:hypothetical protein